MSIVTVGDVDLYYEVHGTGEPVLFLHGLGSSSGGWVFQQEPFAQHVRVILVDLRGHGRSSAPPGPYSIPLFAADVVGLLDALDVSSTHVVGLSLGAMVGFQLAVDHPDRIASLTAVNAGPDMVPHTFAERWNIWKRLLLVRLFSLDKMAEVVGGRLFPDPDQAEHLELFRKGLVANDRAAYQAATKALVGWSVADRLDRIRCPVLVVAAEHDYTPVSAKEAYVAKIPDARLVVVENSRHATPIDQAERFNAAVLAFLREASGHASRDVN
jgi:pimeloyl-ACP methyl ester carboxylesterase